MIANLNSGVNSIVVFNVGTGAVLSARSYSSNGYLNSLNLFKSMVISSGAAPMAYGISRNKSPTECPG